MTKSILKVMIVKKTIGNIIVKMIGNIIPRKNLLTKKMIAVSFTMIHARAEMERVARAKGSPMMFPMRIPFRPYEALEFSIFLNDGECSDP